MTRDPSRIDELLDELEDYWEDNPDLRLGQIINNISQRKGYDDSFYIEDEEVMNALQDMNETQ